MKCRCILGQNFGLYMVGDFIIKDIKHMIKVKVILVCYLIRWRPNKS